MENKRLFYFIVVSLILITCLSVSVLAADATGNVSETDKVANGYKCLENTVANKTTISLEEAIFTTLALGNNNKKAIDTIAGEKSATEDCWPKAKCALRETALVALAYDKAGKDNSKILTWISSKNATPTELNWYLQIDTDEQAAAECTVSYDTTAAKINVLEDMTLDSSNLGNCLEIDNLYRLRIKDNCVTKNFDISCDKGFTTSLLYQKKSDANGVVFVTSTTQSGASGGTTSHSISAKCIKVDNSCNYEGNLWAALALNKNGKAERLVPFLIALADDNTKYFPSTFLYILTAGDASYNNIAQSQTKDGYWEVTASPYKRYYDSALAMLALGSGKVETDSAKAYFLSVQGANGCWNNNNIRSTAFVLYAGWPRSVAASGATPSQDCASAGNFCEITADCTAANGTLIVDKTCTNWRESCCSVDVQLPSCPAAGGNICDYGEICDGNEVPSQEGGKCCIGTCSIPIPPIQETCSDVEGTCRTSCDDNEEADYAQNCTSTTEICCVAKKGGISWIWIILLVILVALVAVGIIYRDKLRLWYYKFKGRAKAVTVARPAAPAGARGPIVSGGMIQRVPPISPAAARRPLGRPLSARDKEMEETLKKLKEISE